MGNLETGLPATRPALGGAGRGTLAVGPQQLADLVASDFPDEKPDRLMENDK